MDSNPARLAGSWKVSFAAIKDGDLSSSTFLDGVINLWPNNWLVLMDHGGSAVEGRFLTSNDRITVGSVVDLTLHRARILDCIISSEVCQSLTPVGNALALDGLKRWKITYSTIKDLDRGRMKAYDGSLELSDRDFWLVLKNAKGHQIGCRYLQKSENISLGAKFKFPLHVFFLKEKR
jgi:hypothetical protein